MSMYIWVKTNIEVHEARPAGYDYSERLEIGGKTFSSKYGNVYDPGEVSVPYYAGWSNDPRNGYDYFTRSVAGVSFEKPEQEFVKVHNLNIQLWHLVSVPDNFAVPSDIPVLSGAGKDDPIPSDPIDTDYGTITTISAGSTRFD
jgi:hypothetical protein